MNLEEYASLQPNIKAHGLTWLTPNAHCAWRVDSLLTKEPDTIAWIEGMGVGDTLFDVGANMGQYSMLAALRGVRVHAFEPDAQNFALLCRNIAINNLNELITPWPIALTDYAKDGPDILYITTLSPGGSCNSLGAQVDYHLKPKQFKFTQGCYATQLDTMCDKREFPTHIKIDVDGFEHKVLDGAQLALERVKSVLVETNTHLPEHQHIKGFLSSYGLHPDLPTAEQARRKDGPFEGIGNVIYYRK